MGEDATLAEALGRYRDVRHEAMEVAQARAGLSAVDARAFVFIARNSGTRPYDLRSELGTTSASERQ